jgi:DNA-directed RNA polymerase specialized sigma24 family protein
MRVTLNHIYRNKWQKKLTKLQCQPDIDEQILLIRLSQGDRTAFWQLWMGYQQYIYRRCHWWMKNDYDSTEYAFNRVMLQAWNRLPNAAAKMVHTQGWLSRITTDICLEIRQERQKIAQCIDSLALNEEHMPYTSKEPKYYIQPQAISPATIACSEWEKYIYLALERLSSQEQ